MKFDFAQLADQSEQLNAHLDHSFLIQRNPEQLNEASKRLASKTSKTDLSTNKAHYLLAGKGFDADKHAKSLNSINLKREFEPLNQQSDTNIEGFLKNEHETILVSTMEEAQKETVERYEKSLLQRMEQDWENRKAKILNEEFKTPILHSTPSKRPSDPLFLTLPRAGGASPVASSSKSSKLELNSSFVSSADAVLNYSRVIDSLVTCDDPSSFPLVSQLREKATEQNKNLEIGDCWEALESMLNELPRRGKEEMSKREKEVYFIEGAKRFLEEQFSRVIQNQIISNPNEAMVGGDPSFIHQVRAFLRMKMNRGQISRDLEYVMGYPLWPQIYYCLRCGKREEIKRLIQEMEATDQRNILGDFKDHFEAFCSSSMQQQSIPIDKWNRIVNFYKEISKSSRDPFQQAVYAILGRCELVKNISVINTTQDFLWLKLNMVKEVESSTVFSAYNYPLSKFQTLLSEYGASHFSRNGRNPFLYFQVLLLSQQFEKAILYLLSIDQFKTQAFYFALCLYHYNLLPPSSPSSSLDSSDSQFDEAFFVSLLCFFVQSLETQSALKYLMLIKDPKVNYGLPEVASPRDLAIKSVLLSSPNYNEFYEAALFYLGEEQTLKIFRSAAQEMDAAGRYEDSFKLYRLAKDPRNSLGVLNNYMGRVLKQKGIESDPLMREAIATFGELSQKPTNFADRHTQSTFNYLITFSEFFYYYYLGDYDAAIQSIDSSALIPSHLENQLIQNKEVESFKLLDENIKRNFSDILLAYMDSLYKKYLRLRSTPSHPSKQSEVDSLRQRARAVVNFAGFLPYKMPQDTKPSLMRKDFILLE